MKQYLIFEITHADFNLIKYMSDQVQDILTAIWIIDAEAILQISWKKENVGKFYVFETGVLKFTHTSFQIPRV